MKKLVSMLLALAMVLTLAGGAMAETKDYSGYTIRIYSNSNSTERVNWLLNAAKEAGFSISIDDNSVISGDNAAIQKANESKDGDIIFGLNETRWSQLVNGTYENLKVMDWTPSWADEVGKYVYPGKAYGLVVQNVLMLYRNDDKGTNGESTPASSIGLISSTAAITGIVRARLAARPTATSTAPCCTPSPIPTSPAGGISVDGWKMLWKYCANGSYTGDSYGFDPLNRGDVQVSTFYSSSLYGKIDSAADSSYCPADRHHRPPKTGALVDIDDGTYYIAEYIGILDRDDRTPEQTEAVEGVRGMVRLCGNAGGMV